MHIMNDRERSRVEDMVDVIMMRSFVGGTTPYYKLEVAKLHPFEPNEKIIGLLDKVNVAAMDNGFEPFGRIVLGGVSDTGVISRAGIPVLCSCGVIGEFNHNLKEYAVVESMFEGAKIYALTVLSY